MSHTGRDPIPISYLISAIHTEQAGTEGQILRLIRAMDRDRFRPTLIALQDTAWTKQFVDSRVPLATLGFHSLRRPADWFVISALARMLKQNQTRIVELHSVDAHFIGAIAAHLAKVPVVISCRRNLGHEFGFKDRMMFKIGNRFVTHFLANSSIVADKMSQLEGVDRSRFEVIHNGVDLQAFDRCAKNPVTAEFDSRTRGKRVISIVANLRPVKNHACFLNAACKVSQRHDDVVFAIMGEGELEAELKRQAEQLGIAANVLWLGSVQTPAPYLVRSDVACLTSSSEGFSNAIVEYMAAGVPVVASNVGGAREAILDGETGFVVQPNDPQALAERISSVLDMDNATRAKLGHCGRRRVEALFTLESQLRSFQSLYSRDFQTVDS